LFCVFSTFGQRTINGRIIDQFLESAAIISIFDKDTIEIGKSDFNGYFKISLSKQTKKLIFAGVGYEWASITIPKGCDNPEIILFLASTYDFMSPRKVDRLRKKEFKKLTELHLQAFQKGLFKIQKPCIIREFEPDFLDLKKIRREGRLTKKRINSTFKELDIGDIVKVPTQTWSVYTNGVDYGCLITGVITEKNRNKKGLNLIVKVSDNICENGQATYNGKNVEIGDLITHNMKYFKIITE